MELLTTLAFPILISILMCGYAGFCWVNQKVHVRGKGWRTKEESPKMFYFTVSIMIFLGIVQLFSSIYFARF
jgi:uncharacterized membrane protein YidH (DUF202 family)